MSVMFTVRHTSFTAAQRLVLRAKSAKSYTPAATLQATMITMLFEVLPAYA